MNKLFLTFLALLLLTGCQAIQTKASAYPQVELSPEVASHIKIRNITEARTDDDLLLVAVLVQSSSVIVNTYYFRFSWLNKDGLEVQGLTSRWEAIVATGKDDPMIINRVASNPKAVDYRVVISDKPNKKTASE